MPDPENENLKARINYWKDEFEGSHHLKDTINYLEGIRKAGRPAGPMFFDLEQVSRFINQQLDLNKTLTVDQVLNLVLANWPAAASSHERSILCDFSMAAINRRADEKLEILRAARASTGIWMDPAEPKHSTEEVIGIRREEKDKKDEQIEDFHKLLNALRARMELRKTLCAPCQQDNFTEPCICDQKADALQNAEDAIEDFIISKYPEKK